MQSARHSHHFTVALDAVVGLIVSSFLDLELVSCKMSCPLRLIPCNQRGPLSQTSA